MKAIGMALAGTLWLFIVGRIAYWRGYSAGVEDGKESAMLSPLRRFTEVQRLRDWLRWYDAATGDE